MNPARIPDDLPPSEKGSDLRVSSQDTAADPTRTQDAGLVTRPWWLRFVLRLLAVFSLVLAIIGAFLPGLPTTVFVLISAWAAARSSPRLHAWLLQHRLFGPLLQNWSRGGFVSRRAKRTAACVMALSAAWMAFALHPKWLAALLIFCMVAVLAWLWRRPEPPASS